MNISTVYVQQIVVWMCIVERHNLYMYIYIHIIHNGIINIYIYIYIYICIYIYTCFKDVCVCMRIILINVSPYPSCQRLKVHLRDIRWLCCGCAATVPGFTIHPVVTMDENGWKWLMYRWNTVNVIWCCHSNGDFRWFSMAMFNNPEGN